MILITFEFFSQVFYTASANLLTALSRLAMSDILDVLIFLMNIMRSLININSSLLSLMIECFPELICSSIMVMTIVRGAWLDESLQLGWIKWLSNLLEPLQRNMRSMTEFESYSLSEYLVGTWLVGFDNSKLNESTIIRRSSLIEEWRGNKGSYKLLWILKSPIIIRRFWILTLVFLRYFKAECKELE